MTLTRQESELLRRALGLAQRARAQGDPPFGSLLADSAGVVLAESTNTTRTDRDITAHPELKLARWAAAELTPGALTDVTMYTSCEPCTMCATAIRIAGIPRVLFALAGSQLAGLKTSAGIPATSPQPLSVGPHLTGESLRPFEGYYT